MNGRDRGADTVMRSSTTVALALIWAFRLYLSFSLFFFLLLASNFFFFVIVVLRQHQYIHRGFVLLSSLAVLAVL